MAQLPMYVAKVNSPVTTLATGISDTDTLLSLVDASVLPSAPNLFTIGADTDNPETVYYATSPIGNNVMVQRAFQGTAQTWSIGTNVQRTFTAYDHDTFVTNINSLVPNSTIVTVDFGTSGMNSFIPTVVTGVTWANANLNIIPTLICENVGERSAEDGIIEALTFGIADVIDGVGFTLLTYAPEGSVGTYRIRCVGTVI